MHVCVSHTLEIEEETLLGLRTSRPAWQYREANLKKEIKSLNQYSASLYFISVVSDLVFMSLIYFNLISEYGKI